jgi:hypothetical protein
MERHEADGLDRILEQNKKLGKGNGQRGAGATSAILPPRNPAIQSRPATARFRRKRKLLTSSAATIQLGRFFLRERFFHLQSAQTEVKRFTVNRFTGVEPLRQ